MSPSTARQAFVGAALLLSTALPLGAQESESGRIIGRVLDAGTARPLAAAQVYLEDGLVGGLTDLDGRFALRGVAPGSHTVVVQMLGYGTKSVTGVTVDAGKITPLDVTLEQQALEVRGITVSATAERGSTAALMDQRRNAEALVDAVGSTEIGRRPDSDAADVAQRMTGVTVTDGKYVFVRGLGERYSQTTLNGSSLPSPEPEKSVVPLDLFPSGFLESLETQKSYTPDMPIDFSGGMVKIETRDFPDRFAMKFGVGTSFNTNSQFEDGFLAYSGGGLDFLGFDDGTRDQPDAVSRIMGGVRSGQRLPADPVSRLKISEALRSASPAFGPRSRATPLNRSFDVSLGGSRPVMDGARFGFLMAGTYSDSYTIRDDERERKWRTSAFNPATADLATPNVDYAFERGTRVVSWGTIGNFVFKPTPSQKISLRTTASLNTDDEARTYTGHNDEDIGGDIRSERSRFVERLMLWGQLSGEHVLLDDHRVEWRLTVARADRDEPMMRETIYLEDNGTYRLLDFTESARYFFSELVDDDLGAEVEYRLPFELFDRDWSIEVGAAWRQRDRSFGARRLNWDFLGNTVEDLDDALANATLVAGSPEEVGEFAIDEVVEPGDVYTADDERRAAYAMLDVPVTERLQAIVGARMEDYTLGLDSRGDLLADEARTDVAPSLNLVFSLTDDVKLRGAVSRTLDRPEFRELAPFQFTEATSLRQLYGNPDLASAEIVSGDLRADWFPRPGELISLGGFWKKMTDPIEQVFVAAASSAYSFQNAEKATVVGIEADVQLRLDRIGPSLRDVSFQANYSWIDSEVRVHGGGVYQPTNSRRPLEGQAAYVFNAGLSWASPSGLETGLFFNRFGERVAAAGGSGIPDIYEQPRNDLDATLAFPLPAGVRARIKGTNLLDADYRFIQSANGYTRVQRAYSVGRTFSVGLSWGG